MSIRGSVPGRVCAGLDGAESDLSPCRRGRRYRSFHFLDQFAAPMANWWETLGNPTLTSELKERLAAGITAETAGRGIAELAAWRNRFLVDLLPLRAGQK